MSDSTESLPVVDQDLFDGIRSDLDDGHFVSLIVGHKGVAWLYYVFSPREHPDVWQKGFLDTHASLRQISEEVLIGLDKTPQYPSESFLTEKSPEGQPLGIVFTPHRLLKLFHDHRRPNSGYSAVALHTRSKLGEEAFRLALGFLIRHDILALARNGYVWLPEEAHDVLGPDFSRVSADELVAKKGREFEHDSPA